MIYHPFWLFWVLLYRIFVSILINPAILALNRNSLFISQLHSHMKSIRLEKGISLAELSNLTGLEIDYLSALENGTISPTLTDFNEIAKALNVPYTDLVN